MVMSGRYQFKIYVCPMSIDIPQLVYNARALRPGEERPKGILGSCDMALRNESFAAGRMGPMIFGGYALSPQPFNPGMEKESLRSRSQALQFELDAVSKRLVEIESQEKAP